MPGTLAWPNKPLTLRAKVVFVTCTPAQIVAGGAPIKLEFSWGSTATEWLKPTFTPPAQIVGEIEAKLLSVSEEKSGE